MNYRPTSRIIKLALLCCVALIGSCKSSINEKPAIVGYYSYWSIYSPNVHIRHLPLDKLNYLVYRSANVSENGDVFPFDDFADVDRLYPDSDIEDMSFHGSYGELINFKKKFPHLKTIISIGGWESRKIYPTISSSDERMRDFAKKILDFVAFYQFDGIEIDWQIENTSSTEQTAIAEMYKAHFLQLAKIIHTEFQQQANPPIIFINLSQQWLTVDFPLHEIHQYADKLSLRTDYINGYWQKVATHVAPLHSETGQSASKMVERLEQAQIPNRKIILTLAPFAIGWQGVDSTNSGLHNQAMNISWGSWDTTLRGATGLYSREHLINLKNKKGYIEYWDDSAKSSYLFNPSRFGGHFISYENEQALKTKIQYALQHRLGGIAIRQLHNDLRSSESVVNEVYQGVYPLYSLYRYWLSFFENYKERILALVHLSLIFTLAGLAFLIHSMKKKKRIQREKNDYLAISSNLHALNDPLIRLYQLESNTRALSGKISSDQLLQLSQISAGLLKVTTRLVSETQINKHARQPIIEPCSSTYIVECARHLVEADFGHQVKLSTEEQTEQTLLADSLFLTQSCYELCTFIVDAIALHQQPEIAIRTWQESNFSFVIRISSPQLSNIHYLPRAFYRLKELYSAARRFNCSITPTTTNEIGFEIRTNISHTSRKPLAELEWHHHTEEVKEESIEEQQPNITAPALSTEHITPEHPQADPLANLMKFSEANFSAKDAASLIEQACDFFCITQDQELKVSVFQEEQLIAKIGDPNIATISSSDFRIGEYKFIIESETPLEDNDRIFFQVLVGQVQMVRRALKTLAKEPTLLSELIELSTNKDKILYLKADGGYTGIYLQGKKDPSYITMRLRNIKQYFGDDYLVQVHRSYLVNPRRVIKLEKLGKMKFELTLDEAKVPVSRTYIPVLKQSHPEWTEHI